MIFCFTICQVRKYIFKTGLSGRGECTIDNVVVTLLVAHKTSASAEIDFAFCPRGVTRGAYQCHKKRQRKYVGRLIDHRGKI